LNDKKDGHLPIFFLANDYAQAAAAVSKYRRIALQLLQLIEKTVVGMGYDLVDFEQAARGLLRVFIDSPGGVDIGHCERVSRMLRPALDATLPDVDLEVSSPGAERRLRGMPDYLRFVGERVNVRFRTGVSEHIVEGLLSAVEEDALTVASGGPDGTRVAVDEIIDARLAVAFGLDDRPHRQGGR